MKKLISIFIVSTLILSSCGQAEVIKVEKTPGKNIVSDIIKSDYFSEQIKLSGKVSPLMETPVSVLAGWIIKNINAEVGKEVKVWQLLAQIDLSSSAYWTSFNNANTAYNNSLNAFGYTEESIKNDLEAARVQLENAKTAKENTYITTQKQLELSQTQLNNIKKNVSNTELTTAESIKNANLMLENAKTNLDNFNKNSQNQLKSLADQEKSTYDDIKIATDNALVSIDSTLTQADIILGVTDKNKNANDSYEVYLWAKNSSSKILSENDFREAKGLYDKFLINKDYSSNEKISYSLDEMINLIEKTSNLCDDMVIMIDNSITSSSFTQNQLDSLKTNALWTWITTKQSAINWLKWALVGAKNWLIKLNNTVITTKTSIDTNLISLQNAINIANAQLENIKAWNNSQLDSVSWNENLTQSQLDNANATVKQTRDNIDNAVKIAQANYDSIQAKLNSQRVQAKSQIDSAKWWKDLAWINLNNTSIVAPFNWVITARNIEIGTMVNPWTPAFMIGDNSQLKIKLDVNSDNITFLNLGQEAQVSKWNNTFTWIISLLSPAVDPTTKMFKAEISFMKKPTWINLWDYVDVIINKVNSTEKMLLVPFSSIISLGQWDYSLFVIVNWIAKARPIKIGSQNSTQVQILSWVKEWEKIVISWTLDLQDWDKVEEEKK